MFRTIVVVVVVVVVMALSILLFSRDAVAVTVTIFVFVTVDLIDFGTLIVSTLVSTGYSVIVTTFLFCSVLTATSGCLPRVVSLPVVIDIIPIELELVVVGV